MTRRRSPVLLRVKRRKVMCIFLIKIVYKKSSNCVFYFETWETMTQVYKLTWILWLSFSTRSVSRVFVSLHSNFKHVMKVFPPKCKKKYHCFYLERCLKLRANFPSVSKAWSWACYTSTLAWNRRPKSEQFYSLRKSREGGGPWSTW